MIQDVLKNFNLFMDGRGYAGNIDELVLPKLTLVTDEHRGGGMDASLDIDLGMEKLECEFTLSSFDKDMLKAWGVGPNKLIQANMRGALESQDGTVTAVRVDVSGRLREIDPGSWKAGEKAVTKYSMTLTYYKLTHGGEVVHEIDVPNMIRIVNGEDLLASVRDAIGV